MCSAAVAQMDRPGRLLEGAPAAAEAVDDGSTAQMLLLPFRLEQTKPEHVLVLVGVLSGYGRSAT